MKKINLVTYNIRTSKFNEKDCSDNLNNWEFRKKEVIKLIKKQSPDIFCLQEDSKEQIEYIKSNFHKKYNIVAFDESIESSNEEYNSIFIAKRYEILESGFKFISKTPNKKSKLKKSICYRHLNYVKVRIADEELIIINVHLDHSEDLNFKRDESNCLLENIKEMAKSKKVILTGDFNFIPENNGGGYSLQKKRFIDAFDIFHIKEPTHANWLMHHIYKQIDYFWLSKDLKNNTIELKIVKDKYLRSDGRKMEPSDHFLIKLVIKI